MKYFQDELNDRKIKKVEEYWQDVSDEIIAYCNEMGYE